MLTLKNTILKIKHAIFIILSIICIDQVLKFYIKLNFYPGESVNILGHWFKLQFVENEGMAWGFQWGGHIGKIFLTLFRLFAVIWGTFFIKKIIQKKLSKGFIICVCMIYSGALGNLIDSLFYGIIFNQTYDPIDPNTWHTISSAFTHQGYAPFLYGRVVDMLYFPVIDIQLPNWVPIMGGQPFTFFDPVFNIADSSISLGIITLILFNKKFLKGQSMSSILASNQKK